MTEAQRALRVTLRARGKQLGDLLDQAVVHHRWGADKELQRGSAQVSAS